MLRTGMAPPRSQVVMVRRQESRLHCPGLAITNPCNIPQVAERTATSFPTPTRRRGRPMSPLHRRKHTSTVRHAQSVLRGSPRYRRKNHFDGFGASTPCCSDRDLPGYDPAQFAQTRKRGQRRRPNGACRQQLPRAECAAPAPHGACVIVALTEDVVTKFPVLSPAQASAAEPRSDPTGGFSIPRAESAEALATVGAGHPHTGCGRHDRDTRVSPHAGPTTPSTIAAPA